jgi:hypothetical protein
MARYYFHLRDSVDVILDPEGREFETIDAIAQAALADARAIIGHEAFGGFIKFDQRIEVEDESGATVYSIEFSNAVKIFDYQPS